MKQADIFLTQYSLGTYREYTIDEFNQCINDLIERCKTQYSLYEITRYTIEARGEDYYGETSVLFSLKVYRNETDEEYNSRLKYEKRIKDEESKKFLKKQLEEEKNKILLKDPEYQKYIELKTKFKNL